MIRKKRILDFHSFFAEKNPANLQIKESEIPAIPDFSDKDTKGIVTLKEYNDAFNPKIGIGRVCERLRSEGRFEGIKALLELYFIEQYKKVTEYSKNPHLYQEYVDNSLKW